MMQYLREMVSDAVYIDQKATIWAERCQDVIENMNNRHQSHEGVTGWKQQGITGGSWWWLHVFIIWWFWIRDSQPCTVECLRETGFHSNQAQRRAIWLMSSAYAAKGGLISETSCCAVWSERRPAHASVKAVSGSIIAAACVLSGHFLKDEFILRDERWMKLISWLDQKKKKVGPRFVMRNYWL